MECRLFPVRADTITLILLIIEKSLYKKTEKSGRGKRGDRFFYFRNPVPTPYSSMVFGFPLSGYSIPFHHSV